ncbi:MAG: nucleoside diphosphate kinase regulator [Croceibacterium sp.]
MQTQIIEGRLPPIFLAEAEADILADLAVASRERSPQVAELLLQEIGRAVTASSSVPSDVVTMMSHVDFVDEGSGELHSVQLVYPRDADTDEQRISVLTPIGAALIGMRCGEAIAWVDLRGIRRRLKIIAVSQPDGAS